jgi:protein-tyrosine phosphatase
MLAASARPGRYGAAEDHFRYLKKNGIKTIVNLCEDSLPATDGFANHFNIVHFPILDGDIPTEEQMGRIIRTVEESILGKNPCLVHCHGGIGRTATVLACVLMTLKEMTLEESLELLRQSGRLPQNMRQFRYIEGWMAKCGKGR